MGYEYDFFICHASEDKDSFVTELVEALRNERVKVWYDELSIQIGDSIRKKIEEGISCSRHGVVVLSPHFLRKKKWTEHELDGLFAIEDPDGERKILPIWYNVTEEEVKKYSAPLAMRSAARCDEGLPKVVEKIIGILGPRKARIKGIGQPTHSWHWCRSSVNSTLIDITFIDSGRGWAVGAGGTLLFTNDSGRNWAKQHLGTSMMLNSVIFRSDGIFGWIAGERGILLETRDGARSWEAKDIKQIKGMTSDVDLHFGAICERGQAVCFVGNEGTILRADANGENWKRVPSKSNERLWSIDFNPSGQIGCIVGSRGGVLVTQNGGNTWHSRHTGIDFPLYCGTLHPNDRTIWIVGDEGTALVSNDLGLTWETGLRFNVEAMKALTWLNACYFSPSGLTGWIVGAEGIMLNTKDCGKSWSVFRLEEGVELTNIWYQSEEVAWCIGNDGSILFGNQDYV